ncbi:AmmeMemoRadiSam system protein B [Gillisia hiemivivida]|uniref:AmmeMemoRadiSam system protein B n=1 Tax=Gillisia hiemivivida TaxID=291190 RepID=A0A5C6ZT10_9FLAO|nr:AmmeMemoRadiSam system protein B [Gillisia hiemivivida]TXD92295.1 AmmeMemoRadiSam system protein B [Gillisia hiemivivida]
MKTIKIQYILTLSFVIMSVLCFGQQKDNENSTVSNIKIRHLEDTIGFPQYKWQMDSILSRIAAEDKVSTSEVSKAVICPHDDYAYAAGLYKKTLSSIKAKTIVLVGVAHRARNFELKDKIVFGSFKEWKTAYGSIKISPLRDKLLSLIPDSTYIVHNEMMQLEHSLEAITPFLQHKNKSVEIIPMLVPYKSFENMDTFSEVIAQALADLMKETNMNYGEDLAVVISSDAIHYGNEGWGSSNLAPFGVDSLGTAQAYEKDLDIIKNFLTEEISKEGISNFNKITVKEENYMEYNWTWCGRYSIPFGVLMANKLNLLLHREPLQGSLVDYRSSIHNKHIRVDDLGMGTTAPAKNTHWVGYAGIKYR